MASPTSRTLDQLRKEGYLAGVVERYIAPRKMSIDLFGVLDIVALHPAEKTLGVQCTSGPNVASRIAKLQAHKNLPILWECGWRVEVWGWRKNAAGRWILTKHEVRDD